LAWEDSSRKVWLSYHKPEYLKERFGFPDKLLKSIPGIKVLVKSAAQWLRKLLSKIMRSGLTIFLKNETI
jgi:hypothetical protein